MGKAMIVIVGTGRDRQDIAHALKYSINSENPNFLVLLVTELSEAETLPYLDPALVEKKYELRRLSDENDIQKIYQQCLLCIEEVIKKGYERITVDYTSGTKAMSAGLCLAAIAKDVDTLNYIWGERDKTGRVIPGTERMLPFKPVEILADKK